MCIYTHTELRKIMPKSTLQRTKFICHKLAFGIIVRYVVFKLAVEQFSLQVPWFSAYQHHSTNAPFIDLPITDAI
jgi:hypothetical protein